MVLGVLVLLEGALTVLWKEPFSALLGSSKSEEAHGEELEQTKRAAQAARERREAIHRRALSLNRKAPAGEAIGRLRIPKIDLKTPVVQGTREDSDLTKGPGHYVQTPLPGTKGDWTVGVAGHRTTYGAEFRRLDRLDKGDTMTLTLPYGRFTYAVERVRIVDDSYQKAFVPKGYDRIGLTACHPPGSAAQRIIAYGKLTKEEPRGAAGGNHLKARSQFGTVMGNGRRAPGQHRGGT